MSWGSLSSELAGYLPGLSGYLSDDWINRAWRKIRESRQWGFLVTDDAIVCPTGLTSGTYNITQFNNSVTANSAASSAFLALNLVETPATFLQIRFQIASSPVTYGQIYNITNLNQTVPSAIVLTLDRVVIEATNATSSYLVYRPYIIAPTTDFLRWYSFNDMISNPPWNLLQDRTSQQFDRRDPGRTNLGRAYYLGAYKQSSVVSGNVTTVPMFELWPGPSNGQTFYVRYRRSGTDFALPTDIQPNIVPDELIIQTALGFYAYPWASENEGHFPAMKDADWNSLITDAKNNYERILAETKRLDDTQNMQSLTAQVGSVLDHP